VGSQRDLFGVKVLQILAGQYAIAIYRCTGDFMDPITFLSSFMFAADYRGYEK
jgi:hypothetical protein